MTERERLINLLSTAGWNLFTGDGVKGQIADYLLANGVIVPPCKVGDTMYVVSRYYTSEWNIYECKVDSLTTYGTHTFMELVSVKFFGYHWGLETSFIGKKVFLTKEDAEKALAERSEGK